MAIPFYLYDDKAVPELGATVTITAGDSDPDFVVGNVLVPDRRVYFKTDNPTDTAFNIDITLAGTPTIGGFGIMNIQPQTAGQLLPGIAVSCGPSFASLTLVASVTGTTFLFARDLVAELPSPQAQPCWRFAFTGSTAGIVLAKIMLGTIGKFSFLYAPGSGYDVVVPSAETRTMDQDPVIMFPGLPRRLYRIKYDDVIDTEKAILQAIASQVLPIGYRDSEARSSHCIVRGPVAFNHLVSGDPPFVWEGTEIKLEQMP